jgi:hypothetical protein
MNGENQDQPKTVDSKRTARLISLKSQRILQLFELYLDFPSIRVVSQDCFTAKRGEIAKRVLRVAYQNYRLFRADEFSFILIYPVFFLTDCDMFGIFPLATIVFRGVKKNFIMFILPLKLFS